MDSGSSGSPASHLCKGVARGPGDGLWRDRYEDILDIALLPQLGLILQLECAHIRVNLSTPILGWGSTQTPDTNLVGPESSYPLDFPT